MYRRFIGVFVVWCSFLQAAEGLYLTYPEDPSHSMALHWFESEKEEIQEIAYRKIDEQQWQKASCQKKPFGKGLLRSCLLLDLQSDVEYVFQWQDRTCHFKTLPSTTSRPVRIAIGGDAYQRMKPFHKMNEQVASHAPDFVILGGDIAYASSGNPYQRWKEFFIEWQKTMVSPDGCIIPIVACVGNHDVSSKDPVKGSLFLDLFPYLQQGSYGSLQVASDFFFVLLDSQHIAPIQGEQQSWLKQVLQSKKECFYKFAVYHIAAYPSVYSYDEKIPKLIRSSWCPVFEEEGVIACFEHHNHAYKRTYPIRSEKIDPEGVVYIGDGAWSVSPRRNKKSRWYLEEKRPMQYFCLVSLSNAGVFVKMLNAEGQLLDEWQPKAKPLADKEIAP